jgi:hypothetical protein
VELHPLHQAHLVHKDLHGPFLPENIALADPAINAQMYKGVEEASINAKADGGQIRYRAEVTYHSNDRPPDDTTEIPDDPIKTVEKWVGFYIAHRITVTSFKWDGTGYSVRLGMPVNAVGGIPPVKGQVIETLDDMCFRVVKAHLDPALPDIPEGDHLYQASTFNMTTLQAELGLNDSQKKQVSSRLKQDGRFHITIGRNARIYVLK